MPKKYPLGMILRVRILRRDAAETELRKKKEAQMEAQKIVDKQKEKIETYKNWQLQYEDTIFKGIIGKINKKSDITDLKIKIEGNKERYDDHLKRLKKFEEAYEKAKEATEAARTIYHTAIFNVQKLDQHKEKWLEAATKEEEASLEKESEEFKGKIIKI